MRWIAFLMLALLPGLAGAAEGGIIKVLPHYLDTKGRHANGPSLLHRDIYQRFLRDNPGKIRALRFDIKWRGTGLDPQTAKLRVEVRSSKAGVPVKIFEQTLKPGRRAQWTAVLIKADDYKKLGKMESWRATLVGGGQVLAEEKSFLW
jgi:hypothetical protein